MKKLSIILGLAMVIGLFSGPAFERIEKSGIDEVVITDSINGNGSKSEKIRVLPVADLLGEAMKRIHSGDSVTDLFKGF